MPLFPLNGPLFLISDGDDGTVAGATGRSVAVQHDLVALPGGGFAVAWESDFTNTPSLQGIGLQVFANNGAARTGQTLVVSDDDGGTKAEVRLTATEDRIALAWEQRDEIDFTNDIQVRLFDHDASAQGPRFRANVVIENAQDEVSLTAIDATSWRATWTSFGQDGDNDGIVARDFDASGIPLTDDVLLGPATKGPQYAPSTVRLDGGGIATAYTDGAIGNHIRLLGLGAPVTLGTELDSAVRPDLAALPGGGVALAYQGTVGGFTWDDTRLAVQIVRPDGSAFNPALIVSTDARRLGAIDVAPAPDGGAFAAWEVTNYDGTRVTGYDVIVQRYDAQGNPFGDPETLSSPLPYNRAPEIATLENGDTVVAWQGESPFGFPNEQEGLLFQRFAGQYVGTKRADRLTDDLGLGDLSGRQGRDRLDGKGGRDDISGGGGKDTLFGGAGHDRLEGDGGNDRLFGQKGRDSLEGGSGKDRLDGGSQSDRLHGGGGNDILKGGKGADTFVFEAGDGRDEIVDFGRGADIVELDRALWDAELTVREVLRQFGHGAGDDLVLRFDDGEVLRMSDALAGGTQIQDLRSYFDIA